MTNLTLGQRLKDLRESLGLKLTEAAERLGYSSYQILSNIEDGKRDVKASELFKFSKVYYCGLDKLLGHSDAPSDACFIWRNPPKDHKIEIEREIALKCERYKLLENLLNVKPRDKFITVEPDEISTDYKVRLLTAKISNQLGLGKRPAFTLQKILEQDYGIKILFHSFPEGSSVSTVNSHLGKIIVVNKDEVPWRQNFDLAHELFHLITWEAVVSNQNYTNEKYNNDIDKKADIFASTLLLPDEEVRKKMIGRMEESKQISDSDLADIAIDFGVSIQALAYRLFYLGYIRDFEQARRLANNIQGRGAILKERESEQYIALAVRCLRKGFISRGKFAELVEIEDRSDIDDYISGRLSLETEGDSVEIMAS